MKTLLYLLIIFLCSCKSLMGGKYLITYELQYLNGQTEQITFRTDGEIVHLSNGDFKIDHNTYRSYVTKYRVVKKVPAP